MANMCSVIFDIAFKDVKAKEAFIKDFNDKRKVMEADEFADGIELIEDKYLFDSVIINNTKHQVEIIGWVKWIFNKEDIISYVKKYTVEFHISKLTCQYEELGQSIYGQYDYIDGSLFDTFVNQDNDIFNRANTEDSEDFYDELQRLLENEGKRVQIALN